MFAANPACAEPETSPTRIKELAERRLRSSPYLSLREISFDYVDGVLVLRGHLPTYYLKQVAQGTVAGLKGVEQIDNRIQVMTPSLRSRRG